MFIHAFSLNLSLPNTFFCIQLLWGICSGTCTSLTKEAIQWLLPCKKLMPWLHSFCLPVPDSSYLLLSLPCTWIFLNTKSHNSMNWLSALSLEDSPFNFSLSSASSWQYCFLFVSVFRRLYSTYCHKQPSCAASVLGGIEGAHPLPSFPRFSYFSLSLGSSYGDWSKLRLCGTVVPSTAFQNHDYFAFCHSTQGKMLIEQMGIKWIDHHFPGQTLNFVLKQILWNANIYSSNVNFHKVCLIILLSFQVQCKALYMFINIKRRDGTIISSHGEIKYLSHIVK